jgi:hypothetical protein
MRNREEGVGFKNEIAFPQDFPLDSDHRDEQTIGMNVASLLAMTDYEYYSLFPVLLVAKIIKEVVALATRLFLSS